MDKIAQRWTVPYKILSGMGAIVRIVLVIASVVVAMQWSGWIAS